MKHDSSHTVVLLPHKIKTSIDPHKLELRCVDCNKWLMWVNKNKKEYINKPMKLKFMGILIKK